MAPDESPFATGRGPWLARLGNLRNVVRQEVVTRQLAAHLHEPPARAVDVGAGQGTQTVALAERGLDVDAVEPDPEMREALRQTLSGRHLTGAVRVLAGAVGDLPPEARRTAYDVVLCHGVLMYLPEPRAAVRELGALVAPGGLLSVVTRNAEAMAWRPALRRDWEATLGTLADLDAARAEGASPGYDNELGVRARADWREQLVRLLEQEDLTVEAWYGVRVATDGVAVDEPVPGAAELARLLDAEERLGRTDPYRRLGTLMHLVARRPAA